MPMPSIPPASTNTKHAAAAFSRPRLVSRRYHFHWPGLAYAGTSVVLVIGAINGQNNLLFAIFGMAVGGLIVSGILSGMNLLGISIERIAVVPAGVGEDVLIRYRVRNTSRFLALMGISIEERAGGTLWRPSRSGPGSLTATGAASVSHLGPGREIIVEARLRAVKRGVTRLDEITLSSTFPFGVTRKSVLFSHPGELVVWPRIDRSQTQPRRGGESTSADDVPSRPRQGHGPDFWSLRDYIPGDDTRSVAWKASARFDRLLVRETAFVEERECLIHVRTQGASPDGIEAALSRAAGLAMMHLRHGAPVTLAVDNRVIAPRSVGTRYIEHILESLARWQPAGATAGGPSLLAIPRRARLFEVSAHDAPAPEPAGAAA
jgi:uncharacterized protein (DUF58 family)